MMNGYFHDNLFILQNIGSDARSKQHILRLHFTVSYRYNTVLCSCMNHNITTHINRHHLIKTYIFGAYPFRNLEA